ncbi:MAG: glycosyltransferase, partial [Oscillospiraceae bacterium]
MQHNKEPFPTVTVAVITYNHADFIVQCVQSILSQRGDFCLEILVFDDCSNDSTLDKLQEICDNNNLPENMSIQLLPSKTNLGMVKNLQRLIEACAAKNNEFTTIIDGDDFYFSDSRIQKNIDFLKVHPDIPMSFNAFIMYNEEVQSWSVFIEQEKYAFDFLPAQLLAQNNIIGNIGCAFYRTKEIGNLPEGLFDIFTGDWFLHLSIANGRNIGFIHEPLSVYRINSNGIWKGKNDNSRYKILMQAIKSYDKLTRKKYHSSLMYYKSKLLNKAIPDSKKEHVDLLIMDDVFPHPLSGFRCEEFHVLLNEFPNSAIALSGASVCVLGKESLREVVRDYANLYPEHISKLSYCDGINMRPPENITASIAYFCFLVNAYYSLKYLEESKTPFVFELYPGGRFARYSETSDKMLREVTASPFFRKVITTQSITTKYLLENKFCTKDKIVEIFGVVTPKALLQPYCMPKKHYGFEKNSLDIVFSAFKYEKTGRDKGYDVFIELAHKIVEKYDNVYFHVVGGFDEKVLDVSALKNHIHFYGKRTQSWFDTFYQDKDIIISPNLPNVLAKGAFDGFPTAACTEAASREVAIFATDILSLNNDHFIPKKEIEIIPHNANEIMHLIEYYLHEPEKLKTLKQNGAKAVRRIYGFEKQMTPRIEVLRKELKWAKENKDAIKEISVEKKEEVESIEDFFTSTLYIMLSNGTVKKIGRKFLADVFNENEIIFNLPKLNSEINSFT